MGDNKRWSTADIAALLWVVLHFFTSIHSYFESWYYTYTGWRSEERRGGKECM